MKINALDNQPDPGSPPPSICVHGTGNLEYGQQTQQVDVRLVMVPGRSITFMCSAPAFRQFSFPQGPLSGSRFLGQSYGIRGSSDGRLFHCRNVWASRESTAFATQTGPAWEGVFVPRDPVGFGPPISDDAPVSLASFALTTYLGVPLEFEIGECQFSLRVSRYSEMLAEQAEAWKMPVEAAVLEVSPQLRVTVSELLSIVQTVLLMLSLLQGDMIQVSRYELHTENAEASEVWYCEQAAGNPVLSRQLRLAAHHQDYLPIGVRNYVDMPAANRNLLRLAIWYHLMAKKEQPVETAFIAEAIAWEMLANGCQSERTLPPEVEELQRRVRSLYGQWRSDFPEFQDPDHIYKQRLCEVLRWRPLREGVEQLLSRLQLRDALPLLSSGAMVDPLLLVKIRNALVHQGQFPKNHADYGQNRETLGCILRIGDLMLAKLLHPGMKTA